MKPFRTSLTARIVSLSVTLALVGGGALAVTGADPSFALPALLLVSIGACIVGLLLGIHDHTEAVALLAIVLPLVLWPYVMVMEWIVMSAPRYGVALLAAGGAMFGLTLLASLGATARSGDRQSADQRLTA